MARKMPQPKPQTRKPRTPVRLPQRSEEVAGNEEKSPRPIAAAQKTPRGTQRQKPAR